MAKSKNGGTRSYIRGRIGSDVYSIGRDGKSNRQQVIRSLADSVENPRTVNQMKSRMIMSSVAQLTKALKPIISHSFDGIKAGQPSISHFRALAFDAYKQDCLQTAPVFGYVPYEGDVCPNAIVPISSGKLLINYPLAFVGDNQYMSSYPGIGFAWNYSITGIGKASTVGEVYDVMFGGREDVYITCVGVDVLGNVVLIRLAPMAGIDMDYQFDPSGTYQGVFDVKCNVPCYYELYGGAQVSDDNFFYFVIKPRDLDDKACGGGVVYSKKVDGKWIHNSANFSLHGNDSTEWKSFPPESMTTLAPHPLMCDDALATYPVGESLFLNGGDL